VTAALCVISWSAATAKKHTIYLASTALKTYQHTDETRGDYYTLQFEVPSEIAGKKLFGAILEFYVDATGATRNELSVRIPVIEIYALKSAFGGSLSSENMDVATGTILNVPPGEGRRLRIDITNIVREYLKEPTKNYGLIVGGLADHRDGSFEVETDAFSGGYIAKIDFHYDARTRTE
jgi:hypothetical protein